MIKIKETRTSERFLRPYEIARKANIFYKRKRPFTSWDYDERNPHHRFCGLCDCCGDEDAVFVLVDSDEKLMNIGLDNVAEHGGKRWIYCVNCGATSHL